MVWLQTFDPIGYTGLTLAVLYLRLRKLPMSQRLFISYSRNDAAFASRLAADLKQHGVDIWIDTSDIHAGIKWSSAIQEGLESSHVMLLLHSPSAATSNNVEDEWQYFLDNKKPIIPILLLPTKIHFQLNRLQWVDFHGLAYDVAFEKLRSELALKGITIASAPATPRVTPEQDRLLKIMLDPNRAPKERAAAGDDLAKIGDPRPGVTDFNFTDGYWCEVPDDGQWIYGDAGHTPLPGFYIAKYPITYAQFQAFIDDPNGYRNPDWWDGLHADAFKQQKAGPGDQKWKIANRPAERVSWYDVMAFCAWLSAKLGYEVRLPTEIEWEKAARGTDGREYPYPGKFDPAKGNTSETQIGQTSAVGIFPDGASPYSALDMSGNVLEWTLTEYSTEDSTNVRSDALPVVRGGSWNHNQSGARAAFRYDFDPDPRLSSIGFRLVGVEVVGVRPLLLSDH